MTVFFSKNNTLLAVFVAFMLGCVNSQQRDDSVSPRYICENAESYAGSVVGDGHCVSLIKRCSGAPDTKFWQSGAWVMDHSAQALPPGTIIATFSNGKYPSRKGYHAAIYISHDRNGIWVWDQWVGKPVHKRLIKTRYDHAPASNTAQAYRVVR